MENTLFPISPEAGGDATGSGDAHVRPKAGLKPRSAGKALPWPRSGSGSPAEGFGGACAHRGSFDEAGSAGRCSAPRRRREATIIPRGMIAQPREDCAAESFRGICAVRNYLKHMGRMDPSYPVHVQRQHARDRLIHLIYKTFRCYGDRFRRCGVKSAKELLEPTPNHGRTPSSWGKKYLDF